MQGEEDRELLAAFYDSIDWAEDAELIRAGTSVTTSDALLLEKIATFRCQAASKKEAFETAPKNRTHILAWASSRDFPDVIFWKYYPPDLEEAPDTGYWRYSDENLCDIAHPNPDEYSHWEPVPLSPDSKFGAAVRSS